MNQSFEEALDNFLLSLTQSVSQGSPLKNSTVKFWEDSFTSYIGKMRIPKHIHKNPRRYFHLHAMKYVIDQTQPQVIWNMCVGNIKISMPILETIFEQAEQSSTPIYVINIDIVTAIVQFNANFIKKHLKNSALIQLKKNSFIKYRNTSIFNILGSVEDFFTLFQDFSNEFPSIKQVFLCLDGLSNAVIGPTQWLHWWQNVQNILNSCFVGWYFTWLQPSTLERKFNFYFDVVLQKHHIPINWVEIIRLELEETKSKSLQLIINQLDFSELETDSLRNILTPTEILSTNLLFRFYSTESKELLVYQALYLTEETITKIVKQKEQIHIGHKDLDQILFTLNEDFYDNKEQNFVKSIPVLNINKK